MSTFQEASETDYRALVLMLDAAYAAVYERGIRAKRAGDQRGEKIARTALTHVLECVLQALNAHVDAAVLGCYAATKPEAVNASDTKSQREDRLKALEVRFSFDRATLPGWDAVARTNTQAGLLKHRAGFRFRAAADCKLSIEESVDLEEAELLGRLDDVHEWVVALGRVAGLMPPAAT